MQPGASEQARELLREEREALASLRELLVAQGAAEADLEMLRQAERDLDELFLLVVVGEFNAGKSAFVNALVGEPILPEGVTPTTTAVTVLRHAPSRTERRGGAIVEVGYPLDLLREIAIVDTPGTNAILREHEEITSQFVPRADLILFVTSADRPFTESERAFMERIRAWSKKIVVVLNKVDLLASDRELADQLEFVTRNVERLLGFSPQVFAVSARLALAAREESDPARAADRLAASGFGPLETFLRETLDERGRLQLKLTTPLGVAERVSQGYVASAGQRVALLAEDIAFAESIESQVQIQQADMRRDFQYRLDEIEKILHEMAARARDFLDDRLRILRIPKLLDRNRLKEDFERVVVGDVAEQIDRSVQALIDWIIDRDVKLWRDIGDQVDRRRVAVVDAPFKPFTGAFEYDRERLLRALGETTHYVLKQHDHRQEAEKLSRSVQDAVTQTVLVEAGAIGLGTVTAILVGGIMFDVTGLIAAGVLASFGLILLPRKKAQVKEQFRSRAEQLRGRLLTALGDQFRSETDRNAQRIGDALAPYDRWARSEHDRATHFLGNLRRAIERLRALRTRAEAIE